METDREIQKIKRIQEMLVGYDKEPDQETFHFSFEKLAKEPLLKDRTGLEKILDLVKDGSGGKITWKEKEAITTHRRSVSVADSEMRTTPFVSISTPTGIDINVSDTAKLKEYFNMILNSLKNGPSHKETFAREEINLKTLGIKIKGNLISKGNLPGKKVLNATDEALIYFLFNGFSNNKEGRFPLKTLANVTNKSEGNIKNRITAINKVISETLSANKNIKVLFISSEPRKGYFLNPKFLI